MNEKILLNSIKVNNLARLSKEERHEIVSILINQHGYTLSQLAKELNVPKSTIDLWNHPERVNKLKISSLTAIINQIASIEVDDIHVLSDLKRLRKILDQKIKNNKLEKKFNKAIGWEE